MSKRCLILASMMLAFNAAAAGNAAPPQPTATLPCTPKVTDVNGVTYYQCGQTYYTQAYSSKGPIFVPVELPPAPQAKQISPPPPVPKAQPQPAQPVQQTQPQVSQAQPTPQQRAADLKQWLQTSQVQLRSYEWVETTVVSKGDEQKSKTQKRCYYGPDGKVQKVVLDQTASKQGGPPGVLPLGRLIKKAGENKKEELTEYMQNAVKLLHSYVPPNPNNIQKSIQAGKMTMQMLDPNRRISLNFADYFKPGDSLGAQIELPANRLLGVTVATYLDSASDAIALNVAMAVLPDNTIYAAHIVLDAKAKDINVTVDNTDYHHRAP